MSPLPGTGREMRKTRKPPLWEASQCILVFFALSFESSGQEPLIKVLLTFIMLAGVSYGRI